MRERSMHSERGMWRQAEGIDLKDIMAGITHKEVVPLPSPLGAPLHPS